MTEHKTRIVCTIGPASSTVEAQSALLEAGMDVARLNLSHGGAEDHERAVENLREASRRTGRPLAILVDLPGPKIRVGEVEGGRADLRVGDTFVLTTEDVPGGPDRASVSFATLPEVVRPGDSLFVNDGLIHLQVDSVAPPEVRCRIRVGGELGSHKGLNLPGIDLGTGAFTERDREGLSFALAHGIDLISQSFVSGPEDVTALREAAAAFGGAPFVIAKIERAAALERFEDILDVADAIMVARGDLGVETPLERIAVVQKRLVDRANRRGRPVITATQMLESMVEHRRPTRAEVTDVANAILDGTDAVMLSAESAIGRHPVEAAATLARIACATEPHRPGWRLREMMEERVSGDGVSTLDLVARSVPHAIEHLAPVAILVPTRSGLTARRVARFRLPVRVTAFSTEASTCRALRLSYGVDPVLIEREPEDWDTFVRAWLRDRGVTTGTALLTQGPSDARPRANHRLEILDLG